MLRIQLYLKLFLGFDSVSFISALQFELEMLKTIKQAWANLIDSYPDLQFQYTIDCKHASHSLQLLLFCLCTEKENSYSTSHQGLHTLAFYFPMFPLFYILILFDICLLLHSAISALMVFTPSFYVSCVQRALYTACSGQYRFREKILQQIIYCHMKGIAEFYFIYGILYKLLQ